MLDGYILVDVGGKPGYVRRDGVGLLREVSTVLFDCDGVLIDARESYNRSISRTVSYLAKELLRMPLPEEAVSDEVLYAFRKSGGFNNDWDTTYAILLYLFTRLPDDILAKFRELYSVFEKEGVPNEPYDRVLKAKKLLGEAKPVSEALGDVDTELLKLAERADSRGLVSIEESLLKDDFGESLKGFAMLMSYPERVGVSTVMTVFEEFFLGSDLFYRKHGIRPRFINIQPGLVAREKPLVKEEALILLAETFGEFGLGIVSGRSSLTAEYTLGGMLKRFNSELTVFVEDDVAVALKEGDVERVKEMGKPNPYALLKAERVALKSGRILYVGDSKEDLIMVERANNVIDRFMAAGVYGCSPSIREVIEMFVENGAYLIAESVNDIHRLFRMMVGGKV